MFTGIIEEIGKVEGIGGGAHDRCIRVAARKVLEGTHLGDSIAVNGVCLTVTRIGARSFEADVSPETIKRTSFEHLTVGSFLNLERALRLEDRLGGHIVSGHIDGVGTIVKVISDGNSFIYEIAADGSILSQLVEKGSVAIEGVSLTIAHRGNASFTVSVIPHTRAHTNLIEKKQGDTVNVECDIIGKYVMRYVSERMSHGRDTHGAGVTASFLAENGFM